MDKDLESTLATLATGRSPDKHYAYTCPKCGSASNLHVYFDVDSYEGVYMNVSHKGGAPDIEYGDTEQGENYRYRSTYCDNCDWSNRGGGTQWDGLEIREVCPWCNETKQVPRDVEGLNRGAESVECKCDG